MLFIWTIHQKVLEKYHSFHKNIKQHNFNIVFIELFL